MQRTCALVINFNDTAQIHFTTAIYCLHENLTAVWNFTLVKLTEVQFAQKRVSLCLNSCERWYWSYRTKRFWKITLKQFKSSSWYTLPSAHNFCERPQPQRPNIAICRTKVLRPCYLWGSLRYQCFYYITTVSITRLCLLCGNIWRAFDWEK